MRKGRGRGVKREGVSAEAGFKDCDSKQRGSRIVNFWMLFTDWQLRQRRQLTRSLVDEWMITNNRVNSQCHSHTHNGQVDSVFHSKSIQSQSKPQWRQHIFTTTLRYPLKTGPWRKQRAWLTDGAIVWTFSVCCDNRRCDHVLVTEHTHTLTALRLSVYLIILPILNFISAPNEIFVGICNFNLLISLTFMPILFGNLLFLINVKFAHFSVLYTIIYYGENKNIASDILYMSVRRSI